MTLIGILLFLGGWIYAIGAFGVFLGVALGWLPALFFAWIMEVVVLLILGTVLTLAAHLRPTGTQAPLRRVLSLPRLGPQFAQVKSHAIRLAAVALALICLGGGAAALLQDEFNGLCQRAHFAGANYQEKVAYFRDRNVDLADLDTYPYALLEQKYGFHIAQKRTRYSQAKSQYRRAKSRLSAFSYCRAPR